MPEPTDRPRVERLVACDKFILDRWRFEVPMQCGGDNRCHLVAVLEGSIRVEGETFQHGHSFLIPAACNTAIFDLQGMAVLLDMYLP